MTEPITGTGKIKLQNGNFQKIIEVAHGNMTQEQLADYLNTNTTVVSRNINDWMKAVIMDLQSQCNKLQERETKLQATVNELQADETKLQALVDELKYKRDVLMQNETVWQCEVNELKAANNQLKETGFKYFNEINALKKERDSLQAQWDSMYGQITPLQKLGSAWAVLLLSIMIVSLDFHSLNSLLRPKTGDLTAFLVSGGLAFALLVFTASKHKGGRRLAIFSTFVIVGLFMNALQSTVNIFQSIASGSLPLQGDMVSIAITVISPWMNKELTKMLDRKELDQSDLLDWAKVWRKVKSFLKLKS